MRRAICLCVVGLMGLVSGCGLYEGRAEFTGFDDGDPCGPGELGRFSLDEDECDLGAMEGLVERDTGTLVFVAKTGSSGASGTKDDPVGSVSGGVELANSKGADAVIVRGTGTYEDKVKLVDGVSVIGGYGESWQPLESGAPKIVSTSTDEGFAQNTAVYGEQLGPEGVGLRNLRIEASGDGKTKYGVRLVESDAVSMRNVEVVGGEGLDGEDGADGMPGVDGEAGQTVMDTVGGVGGINEECETASGGNGGQGEISGTSENQMAQPGEAGLKGAAGGEVPDQGTTDDGVGNDGSDGSDGEDGSKGESGGTGEVSPDGRWALGSKGERGEKGKVGGGGGGGSGGIVYPRSDGYSHGGGGGGAGGCGGQGGEGGSPGGASFGVFLVNTDIELEDVQISTKDGGQGGEGGQGGAGGEGGAGGASEGNPSRDGQLGGSGGAGGAGGDGGKGGPGLGGVSIGVVCSANTSLRRTSVQVNTGSGGMSGEGMMRAVSEDVRGCQ